MLASHAHAPMRAPRPSTSVLAGIPSGSAGTRAVLKAMVKMVLQAITNPQLRSVAIDITRGVPNKHYAGEVRAVQVWVQRNIRYVRDVAGIETLTTPEFTFNQRAGDCDDQSMLVATWLMQTGHPCRFVAVGPTLEALQHVFVQTRIGPQWVAVETTEPWPLGAEPNPQNYPARMVEHI